MKRIFFIIVMMLLLVAVIEKHHDTSVSSTGKLTKLTYYTVENKPLVKPLYFSGTINPDQVSNILSPVEGVVKKLKFHYGQQVKKGQVLLLVDSPKLQQNFQSDLSGYLKSLDDYNDKERQYVASKNLRKLQFISDDDYFGKKDSRDEAYMAMLQAKFKLMKILKEMGLSANLSAYKKLGREKIVKSLLKKWSEIEIKANKDGIALAPIHLNTDDKSKPVAIGSLIKDGQVLVTIGDLSGLRILVHVNETEINKIKLGLPAKITGPAFQHITLIGSVVEVNQQAQNETSGLPTFPVVIQVKTLSREAKKIIHVGMSAKVEIDLKTRHVITVPIEAVYEKAGKNYVNLKNKKFQQGKAVQVETGETTINAVVVKKGLKAGDIIVYHP